MKTLGIFGDSYGEHCLHGDRPSSGLVWTQWLQAKGHSLDVWARSGTSIWYTYRQFLEHHEKYHYCVVMITEISRSPIRDEPMISTISPDYLDSQVDMARDLQQKERLRAARLWLLWAQHIENQWDQARLYVREMQRLRPDALIIPCFGVVSDQAQVKDWLDIKGRSPEIPGWQGQTLWAVSELDHQHYGLDLTQPFRDLRHSHMNDHNNQVFSEEIHEWISGGPEPLQTIDRYRTPTEPRDFYFRYD